MADDPKLWYCPACVLSDLPFADCSHLSTNSDSPSLNSTLPDDPPDPMYSTNLLTGIKNQKGIKIAHLNICSLYPKLDQLKLLLHDKILDILFISETWLNDTFSDSELLIPGYNLLRNDRSSGRGLGGGLCVYIKDKFSFEKLDPQSDIPLDAES